MRLPKFEHVQPSSREEASRLLQEHGFRARLVAGGTDLYPRMKYGVTRPDVLISLKRLSTTPPTVDPNGDLHIDALMPLADLARSQTVLEKAPLLSEAALSVASNQIRHMGTLGGNLCQENRCLYYNQTHTFQFMAPCFKRNGDQCYLIPKSKKCFAVFPSDTAPALISLGASAGILGPKESRRIPLENLYTGDPLNPLTISDGEVLTEVILPGTPSLRGTAFVKFTLRGGMEYAAFSIAVVLDMENDGILCRGVRITVGSVGAGPIRAGKGEQAMAGQRLSKNLFREVAQRVVTEAHPFPHHGYSAAYLRTCLEAETRRALSLAAEQIDPNPDDPNYS
jgi:4-hydroxybenzoyl-CoA reductase subunit beta